MTEILKSLLALDKELFYLINKGTQNPLFDKLMPFLTDFDNWKIPMLLAWLALIIWGGRKGRILALVTVITITISDQTSSHLLKPLIGRIRPCNVLEDVRLLVNCTGSYSFPSGHATNMFALATLFSYKYRKLTPYFFILASTIAYSRVYVGVHYPFDVIAGALLGCLCAGSVLLIEAQGRKIWQKYRRN